MDSSIEGVGVPRVVSATEARVHFGELIRRVAERHETVYVERGGKPQVVVLAIADYERLLSAGEHGGWLARARKARDQVQAEIGDRTLPAVEDLIQHMREERDEQLTGLR
jgi:prevent-host-death family protein